jgi:hypothetical protein
VILDELQAALEDGPGVVVERRDMKLSAHSRTVTWPPGSPASSARMLAGPTTWSMVLR